MRILIFIRKKSVNNIKEIMKEMKNSKMILIIETAKGYNCNKEKIMKNLYNKY